VHALDEQEVGPAEVDDVPRVEFPLAVQGLVVDAGAVEAVEVADAPAAVAPGDLGVFPGTQVVFEDNAVGSGPAQGVRLAGRNGEDVAEAVFAADHEIG
jgi:hypothetical protein